MNDKYRLLTTIIVTALWAGCFTSGIWGFIFIGSLPWLPILILSSIIGVVAIIMWLFDVYLGG